MKKNDNTPAAIAMIIIIVVMLMMALMMVYSKMSDYRDARTKAARDSINASREYYLDSILNYKVDTGEYKAGEIKGEDEGR